MEVRSGCTLSRQGSGNRHQAQNDTDYHISEPRPDFPPIHKGHIHLSDLRRVSEDENNAEDGHLLASADSEGLIALWQLLSEGPKLLKTFEGHSQSVVNMSLLPSNPKLLVSASYDGTVRLWSTDSGAQISVCQLLNGGEKITLSPDSQEKRDSMRNSISSMIVTPDGRIIFGGGSGYVRVWDANTG